MFNWKTVPEAVAVNGPLPHNGTVCFSVEFLSELDEPTHQHIANIQEAFINQLELTFPSQCLQPGYCLMRETLESGHVLYRQYFPHLVLQLADADYVRAQLVFSLNGQQQQLQIQVLPTVSDDIYHRRDLALYDPPFDPTQLRARPSPSVAPTPLRSQECHLSAT